MRNRYRDQMTNARLDTVGQAAMGVLNGIQTHSPGVQLAGLMVAAQAMAEALDIEAADGFQTASNMRVDAVRKHVPEILALPDYIEGEIKK